MAILNERKTVMRHKKPQTWCAEQLKYFKDIKLYPEAEARSNNMRDFVDKFSPELSDISYMDLWSWVMRNSELFPGGWLRPNDYVDVSSFPGELDRLWAREYLKRWDKYLCSDGVIRVSCYDDRYDEIARQIMAIEDSIIADRAAEGYVHDWEENYGPSSLIFINPSTGARKGWFG